MEAHAVVFTAPKTVEFRALECPDPGPTDAVIRLTHSWISNGTEGSYLRGERIGGDTPYRPGNRYPFPIVTGYQRIGVVERVGSQITDLSPGETVFSVVGKVSGMFMSAGGQVSPSVSDRNWIWKLPPKSDPLAFSGLVLTQVGFNCGARAPIQKGEWSVVLGDGLVGQWSAQTLASRGASVVMIGRRELRLQLAQQLISGCRTVNQKAADWHSEVKSIAGDQIAVAVDTVGSPEFTQEIISLLKRCGHIVSAGFIAGEDRISLQLLRDKEISLDSVAGYMRDRMDQTLDLVHRGVLKTVPLITHHFPARKAADAWKLIESHDPAALGVVLDW